MVSLGAEETDGKIENNSSEISTPPSSSRSSMPLSRQAQIDNSDDSRAKDKASARWKVFRRDIKQIVGKTKRFDLQNQILRHGLQHRRHLSFDKPVCDMIYCEATAGFISLHQDGTVQHYHHNGSRNSTASSNPIPYKGLTSTQLPNRLVGWGPGANLTLLDRDFQPVAQALDPMDVQICHATEQSMDLVTAGAGNVCVWCLTHMVYRVKVTEGLEHHTLFTQLVLAPPGSKRQNQAFTVCGKIVTVIDLINGQVLNHNKELTLRDITALVYYAPLDYVVTASKDISIRVWGPNWELCLTFVGHTDVVTAMVWCPESGLLLSTSLDYTLRCWSLEGGDEVQCVPIESKEPPLALGGPGRGGTLFSFSQQGVDFWTTDSLYSLHCKLEGELGGPVRQIVAPPCPPLYPTRVLCITGDRNVSLVAAKRGAVLTSFRAKQRIQCADYCLPKEILLVLTEEGTVIQASTLTNPVTQLNVWRGRGQMPWERDEYTDGEGDQNMTSPGPASYLVLYSTVADSERALAEWRALQEHRGERKKIPRTFQDTKNKYLVMLGHSGGCVSVLTLEEGKVQYRTPAHNGQRITAMQAHPENSYLFTAGEDNAVLVWRIFPYAQECLSLHLNLFCGQPILHMGVMGTLLGLSFQEPHSATFSLVCFSLATQKRTDHPPSEDHLDCFTGLGVCPLLRVFASSSLDGTVRFWDDHNNLVRTLQLGVEPECLSFVGEKGDLLMGIRGDLYRICSAQLLPQDFRLRLLCTEHSEPTPDLPIMQTPPPTNIEKSDTAMGVDEENEETSKHTEHDAILTRNRDLTALLQGTAERREKNPVMTRRTKKEAFDNYIKMIYNQPPSIKIGDVDTLDLQATLYPPKLKVCLPLPTPTFVEGFFPNPSLAKPIEAQKTTGYESQLDAAPAQRNAEGFKPNSVLVGHLWPDVVVVNTLPEEPFQLRADRGYEENKEKEEEEEDVYEGDTMLLMSLMYGEDTISPVMVVESLEFKETSPPPPSPPPVVEKVPYTLKTLEERIYVPAPIQQTIPPSPPRSPTPDIPEFLKPLVEDDWFQKMYPDRKSIPRSINPGEFSMLLLPFMEGCRPQMKIEILGVLLELYKKGELKDTSELYKGLMSFLRKSCVPHMPAAEKPVIGEIIKLLLCLSPDNYDLIAEMLTILAHSKLGLQTTVVCVFKFMGVREVDLCLRPEVEPWESTLQGGHDIWKGLCIVATHWLTDWKEKYQTAETKKHFTAVDVLNYFGRVTKELQELSARVPQQDVRKDAVLLPLPMYSSKPIQRLGENYSMSRTRKQQGIFLPPLPHRPVLMGFTPFLTLPLHHISPSPFPPEKHSPKSLLPRYFIQERSFVQYYR